MEIATNEDFPEIREAIARLCEPFDDRYWQDLDRRMDYPEEFVLALSEAGFLGALIPEEHGGSGLSLRAATVILAMGAGRKAAAAMHEYMMNLPPKKAQAS